MTDYVLRLFGPLKTSGGFHSEITTQAKSWRRSIRLQGGYWQGSFEVDGELAELQQWFYERLGWHVQEVAGSQISWEGLVYELELEHQGIKRRRSLDTLQNAVRAYFSPYEGRESYTSWQTTSASIGRYGRKEELLTFPGYVSEDTANAHCASRLRENSWPWAQPLGIETEQPGDTATRLQVNVCGYAFCANWRYVARGWWFGPGSPEWIIVSDWITELAAELTEFLTLGTVQTNDLWLNKWVGGPVRLWDFLASFAELGDTAGDRWRIYVGPGRRLHYEQVDLTPQLFWRQGQLVTTTGSDMLQTPYVVQPCVVRDLTYPRSRAEPGSMLADARDMLVTEVEVAEGKLSLHTALWSEAELLAALLQRRQTERSSLQQFWSWAAEEDRRRREQEWRRTHPIWVPFPG
jgi:hypothetical protein